MFTGHISEGHYLSKRISLGRKGTGGKKKKKSRFRGRERNEQVSLEEVGV